MHFIPHFILIIDAIILTLTYFAVTFPNVNVDFYNNFITFVRQIIFSLVTRSSSNYFKNNACKA